MNGKMKFAIKVISLFSFFGNNNGYLGFDFDFALNMNIPIFIVIIEFIQRTALTLALLFSVVDEKQTECFLQFEMFSKKNQHLQLKKNNRRAHRMWSITLITFHSNKKRITFIMICASVVRIQLCIAQWELTSKHSQPNSSELVIIIVNIQSFDTS